MKKKTGNPVGRPPLFKTPDDLQKKIDEYKEYLTKNNKPPTIAGLAYFTGIDRQSLYNYKEKDEFFGTIKEFVTWILMEHEEMALTNSSAGLIFLLKNYGYTDKQEIESKNDTTLKVELSEQEADAIIKKYGNKNV